MYLKAKIVINIKTINKIISGATASSEVAIAFRHNQLNKCCTPIIISIKIVIENIAMIFIVLVLAPS